MSVPGLVMALALSLLVVALVARPLLRPARRKGDVDERLALQREQLETYYERVLTNIRDLDEDFATGKMGEDDYRSERDAWVDRGIRLLRALDQLGRERAAEDDAADIDRAIEAAVAAYREELRGMQPESVAGESS